MEKQVIFRDYQEAQTADFNNQQSYVRQAFDDLVNDAVTESLRYSGFNTVKSNTAEITVAPGRFYGANANGQIGAVFALPTSTIISLVQYLAISTQRYLTLVVNGAENQVDVQTRKFLTNTQTRQTQPQAVPMTDSRDAVLAILSGAEGPTPQPPAIGVNQVAIANILMNATGVVSVTMLPAALVTSTEDLDTRVGAIETFDSQTGPRISALSADLADLANRVNGLGSLSNLIEIYRDMAEVKAKVGLPAAYSQYGADYFLWPDGTTSDINNSQSLGWHADVEMGVRFPAQNAAEFALSLFNPLDPNAAYSGGLLLPAYTSVLKLQTGAYASSIAMGQYGYQTYALVQQNIAYSRIRDGGNYSVCSNGVHSQTAGDTTVAYWLPNFTTYETVVVTNNGDPSHFVQWGQYYWHDSWTEPYWSLDTVNHAVNGAQLAQSFLVSSDMWVTQLAIFIATVASATDVNVTLCKCTNGQPDLTRVIAHVVILGANLVTGWNKTQITPAFCSKGDRMAVVVTSNANHQIGMAAGGSYLDGTFFYSLDGVYYLGDFTKEMMLQVYGAQFASAQVTVQLNALNLAGGIRDIDLTARTIVPGSCDLVFEVQPAGSATWLPITPDAPLVPFAGAPVLCSFRARFVGTKDVMPGLMLPDSICTIWCPDSTFTYVSESNTLLAPSSNISVRWRVENYNLTAHTFEADLYAATAAIGNFTFATNPVNGTTITLGTTVVTFVTSGATGNQVNIGVALGNTLASLQTLLAGSADAQIIQASYAATATALNITYKTAGTAGNTFALATNVSGATRSAATLTGGAAFAEIEHTAITTTLVDQASGAYYIQTSFSGIAPISAFTFWARGTTNAVANTFLVAEVVWWAL